MGQTTTGLFQTITAAASSASKSLKFKNSFIGSIYWDTRPVAETPFTVLSVNIPTVEEGDVADIGSGGLQPSDNNHGTVPVPYNRHFSTSFVIKTWDQARSAQQLRELYFDPKFEALARKINRTIANLITTANFPNYAMITGSGADKWARTDLATAWANLTNVGVPVEDTDNLSFLTSPTAWANTLADSNFNNQYIVGDKAAIEAQQQSQMALIFGARPKYDQAFGQMPFNAGQEPGLLMHRFAISAVTSPPPATPAGLAQIDEQIVWINGKIPVQVQAQYSMKDQGILIHLHCYWGVAVTRPEFGCLLQTT